VETTKIDIDLDVYKAIQQRFISFSDTPNEVLRRVFGLEPTDNKPSNIQREGLYIQGVLLKNGLKLRRKYCGKLVEATVEKNHISYNGKEYTSPSGAARAVTENSVNGWVFWQYYDEKTRKWQILSKLRETF